LKYDAGENLDEVKCLEQRCREVDAHYGWVLASNIVHIAQMFEMDSGKGRDKAKYWVRSVIKGNEELKTKLGILAAGSERRAIERLENRSP
jgi:flagellar biosynthesis/type III secretory pathway chaperone